MQITQFLVGFTFAAGHLFVEYTIPASTIYAGKYGFKAATSALVAAASTMSSEFASPTATAGANAWLKKLAYRAAGQEGLAENVRNNMGEVFGPEAAHVQETLSQMANEGALETVPCIDTTGQSFAIWLNLFYLAPLTWLFLRFFIRSYSRSRGAAGAKSSTRRLSKSASDALDDVDKELDSLGRSAEDSLDNMVKKVRKSADKRRVSETIEKFEKGLAKGYDTAVSEAKDVGAKGRTLAAKASEEFTDKVNKWRDRTVNGNGADGEQESSTPQKSQAGVKKEKEEAKPEIKTEEPEEQKPSASQEEPTTEEPNSPQDSGVLVDKEEGEKYDDKENQKAQGLSTANPKEEGTSYAEKVKK